MSALDDAKTAHAESVAALDAAAAAERRAATVVALLSLDGPAYAPADGDPCGTHLVADSGRLLGDVTTTTRGVLSGWFASPVDGSGPLGPFRTVRRGAAALVQRSGGDCRGLRVAFLPTLAVDDDGTVFVRT